MSPSGPSDLGASLIELIAASAVVGLVLTLALPVTARVRDDGQVRQAAGYMAARFRLARHQAVARGAAVGLVFDRSGEEWSFRTCEDGNGNGVRRSELVAGPDRCVDGPRPMGEVLGGAAVDVDPAIPGPDGTPPTSDPVRFGSSDVASFSPSGSCTPGSLYLRSSAGIQYAVRIAGPTGRTRILRYDPGEGRWREF